MMRGRFLTFEGGEGTGKSTQARMLAEALAGEGSEVVLTREPGGTPGAEAIRGLLLDPAQGWKIEAEALLFAAARADHVANVIRPALDRGAWVVCDRFLDSSRAYQGSIGDADLLALHRIGSGGLLPDVTVLIEVEEDERMARLSNRDGTDSDRIGGRDAEYHREVATRFARFADAEPDRFVRVDGEGTPEEVHRRVREALLHIAQDDE